MSTQRTERGRSPWYEKEGYIARTVYYSNGTQTTVYKHREIVEKKLGRKLGSHEVVHHKDEIRSNNNHFNAARDIQKE